MLSRYFLLACLFVLGAARNIPDGTDENVTQDVTMWNPSAMDDGMITISGNFTDYVVTTLSEMTSVQNERKGQLTTQKDAVTTEGIPKDKTMGFIVLGAIIAGVPVVCLTCCVMKSFLCSKKVASASSEVVNEASQKGSHANSRRNSHREQVNVDLRNMEEHIKSDSKPNKVDAKSKTYLSSENAEDHINFSKPAPTLITYEQTGLSEVDPSTLKVHKGPEPQDNPGLELESPESDVEEEATIAPLRPAVATITIEDEECPTQSSSARKRSAVKAKSVEEETQPRPPPKIVIDAN